jgi:hypothetical protein
MPSPANDLAGENRMFDAKIVVSLVLTVLLATASAPQLLDKAFATNSAEHQGVSRGLHLFVVGACNGLALVGLIVGLFWWPMEIVAASGVALLMIAAVLCRRCSGWF